MSKETIKRYFVPLFDFSLILISYLSAFLIRFDFNRILFERHYDGNAISFVLVMAVHFTFYMLLKIRYTVWHQTSITEFTTIFFMNFASAVILVLMRMTYLLPGHPFTVIVLMFIINTMLMFFARVLYRLTRVSHIQKTKSRQGERILIYGAGSAGRLIISEILENKDYNYHLLGLIDDNKSLSGTSILRIPILGGRDKLEKLIDKFDIETIILAMPSVSKAIRQDILNEITQYDVEVKMVSSSQNLLGTHDFRQSLRKVNVLDLLGRQEIVIDDSEIETMLDEKVILVTGAGGSIGSELVRQIVERKPKKVILLDINETGIYALQQELNDKMRDGRMPFVPIVALIKTIRDYPGLEMVYKKYKPQIVYHAAAHKHVPLMETVPEEAIKNNILGTHNLIRLSIKYEVEKFINISTDKAVNPTNVMGATKRFIEMMLQAYNSDKTQFVAVRFGNVLGSNGSVIPLFEKQIAHGGPITLTHPEITRYFMTIPEAVSLVLQAGTYAKGGEIFVLDMGKEVKIKDMALKMIELSGLRPHKDIRLEYIGLRPGEKLYEELLMDEEGMTKTPNELIYIAKPMEHSLEFVESAILEMKDALNTPGYQFYTLLESIVPTYARSLQ